MLVKWLSSPDNTGGLNAKNQSLEVSSIAYAPAVIHRDGRPKCRAM